MFQVHPWDPRMPPLQLKTLGQARREVGAVRTSKNVLRLFHWDFVFGLGVVLWCWGSLGVVLGCVCVWWPTVGDNRQSRNSGGRRVT